jgi:UrcA family protein
MNSIEEIPMSNVYHPSDRSDNPLCKLILMALCAVGLVAAIAEQQTASADDARTAKVSMAGLDLSTAAGVRAARVRLQEAAQRLCTQVEDPLDLSHHENYLACMDESMTAALQQLRLPALAAIAKAQERDTP